MSTGVDDGPGGWSEVTDRLSDVRSGAVSAFATALLRGVRRERASSFDPGRVAHHVLDAFRLMDERAATETTVRVTTPEMGLDGSSAPGTVVQVSAVDRPFLLSSVVAELEHRGLTVLRRLHPILGVRRDRDGRVTAVGSPHGQPERESFLHLSLAESLDAGEEKELEQALRGQLADVVAATGDYDAIRSAVEDLVTDLRSSPPRDVDAAEVSETAALLEWLLDDNLVLLGWRESRLRPDGERLAAEPVPGSGLGVLDGGAGRQGPSTGDARGLTRRSGDRTLLTVSRTRRRATVHRRIRMDWFRVTRYDADGAATGEAHLLGLLTRKGVAAPAADTPVIRRKLEAVLEREGVVEDSHDQHTIESVFQALPKDELFRTEPDQLRELVVALLRAEEQAETGVVARYRPSLRTLSALVSVPRQRWGPRLRRDVTTLLRTQVGATAVDVDEALTGSNNVLVRFTAHLDGPAPAVATRTVEEEVRRLTRSWAERLGLRLREEMDGPTADRLAHRFAAWVPATYRQTVPLGHAVQDVRLLEGVDPTSDPFVVVLHEPRGSGEAGRLKIVAQTALSLTEIVPVVESVGLTVLDEQPFQLDDGRETTPPLVLHDLGVWAQGLALRADGPRLTEAISAAWTGRCEIDALNGLVLSAGLTWEQTAVLRAYRRLRRQLGTPYTPAYVNEALTANPAATRAVYELFAARFDPAAARDQGREDAARSAAVACCDEVASLDHDRILRGFVELIGATLRTNAFRDDAAIRRPARGRAAHVNGPVDVPYLSLKIDPGRIESLDRPVPHREVFVYSPDMEGVHLRAGPVSRGGLRASDRQDDVRTEVRDLLSTQVLKNALIVPTGAKGGFVVKDRPEHAEPAGDEVRRQYTTFLRGLLDVTDDLEGEEVLAPPGVRRHDGDDPYLVVAPDKGTAAFSDLANDLADDYGFWLGDAFASGGSSGYDHKALGITARGAWRAVRRHFRELGIDTQTEPITVVGIGDMSGDVFGNAMLASRTIRLVAAFDHRDIFIDPDPDQAAFAERQRLFDEPGSSWQDFDRSVLSEGGAVFSRRAKQVTLSPPARQLLDLEVETLEPAALIRAVLRCRADLLFAGGIGTYVKASGQAHARVGDRANDHLRIDATELRARVVGEGANLAVTPAGRVEYARRGGRINQDAIDNAGGVAISDREVNCKILLDRAVRQGRIDRQRRGQLLDDATDRVVAGVLEDVDRQTRVLTVDADRSARRLDDYRRLLEELEEAGILDREATALPADRELDERADAGAGLTRPELATLLAGTKRHLAEQIGGSSLPQDPALEPLLERYFPSELVAELPDLVTRHRLRDRLVATRLVNLVVDRMGITFTLRVGADHDVTAVEVLRAHWIAHRVAGSATTWRRIEQLEPGLEPEPARELSALVRDRSERLTRAVLHQDASAPDPQTVIDRDRPVYTSLRDRILELGTSHQRNARQQRAHTLIDDGVGPDLAVELAGTDVLRLAADIAAIVRSLPAGGTEPSTVADTFLRLADHTGIDTLQRLLATGQDHGRWRRRHRRLLQHDLWRTHRRLTEAVLSTPDPSGGAVAGWVDRHDPELTDVRQIVRDLTAEEHPSLDAVAVAIHHIRDLLAGTVRGR